MASELAAVYVSVIPTAQGISGKLEELVGGPAKGAGTKAGKSSGDGFLSGMGGALKGGIATLVAAAGVAAVKGFTESIEREAAGDKIAASFGLSPEEQARTGSVAGKLYADAYGDSFAEVQGTVAQIMDSFGDLSDEALADVSANALDFAKIFDVDVTEAVDRAGILLKTGLVDDADEAFDLLTRGMQELPVSVRDELLEATQEYSTFFAEMGLSGQEAFDLIAKASETGGQFGIDKLGDAFKEFSIRATDMSSASVEAFETAGLNAQEMAEMFLAGGDTAGEAMDKLAEGLLSIEDPVAQSNAAIALFGTPFEDLNQTVPEFLENLSTAGGGLADFEGAADRAGDTLNDNLGTKIESIKRTALQELTDFITERAIPGFSMMSEWIGDNVPKAVDFLVDAFGGMDDIRKTVKSVTGAAGSYIDAFRSVIETTLKIVTDLWERFGSDIVNYVSESFDNVLEFAQALFKGIRGVFEVFAGIFTGDWRRVWDGIKAILSGVWDAIRALVEQALNLIDTVIQVGLGIISAAWSLAWNAIKTLLSDIWNLIKKIPGAAMDFIEDAIGAAMTIISDAWDTAWEAIKATLSTIWDLIKEIPGAGLDFAKSAIEGALGLISTVWSTAWEGLKSTLSGIWDGIKSTVSSSIDSVVSTIQGIPSRIANFIGSIKDAGASVGSAIINGLKEAISGAANIATDIASGLGSAIKNWLNTNVIDRLNRAVEFTIPIPFAPDVRINPPDIPRLHGGGVVTGRPGEEVLRILEAGEVVFNKSQQAALVGMLTSAARVEPQPEGRAGLIIENATFGDERVVPDLDFWVQAKQSGVGV